MGRAPRSCSDEALGEDGWIVYLIRSGRRPPLRGCAMKTRREFLELTAAVALTSAFRFKVEERSAPLRILILGGTCFVGPHIVHAALARGHPVAMLNRGQRAPNQNT